MQTSANIFAHVHDNGLSILYQPTFEPLADVVFVHGLQGHPRRTWTKPLKHGSPAVATDQLSPSRLQFWKRNRRKSSKGTNSSSSSSPKPDEQSADVGHSPLHEVFWPQDLLPYDRPDVRVLTWGYDTMLTRGWQPANKNNLFAHARDLLYALEREHPPGRPLIFVAHSLGGIMVKEVLRRSELSREDTIRDVICSTTGIIFLGTPHRGSPGFADLGEIVRRTASTILRVDTNATILRTLGCDSPELELCRESFTSQWREHQFRVKTFQESLGISGIGIGCFADKVVPDTSSLLDDVREHAETIGDNHMDMVRFGSQTDPGYQKVAGELRMIVTNLYNPHRERFQPTSPIALPQPPVPIQLLHPVHPNHAGPHHATTYSPVSQFRTPQTPLARPTPALSDLEKECLEYLSFSQLGVRQDNIKPELEGTCRWIYDHRLYQEWEMGQNGSLHRGLLWIKGRAGAGKSVIMKNILREVRSRVSFKSIVASFFFNARGTDLERNTMGMYRSLLYQMIQQDERIRQAFLEYYLQKRGTPRLIHLHEGHLQEFIKDCFSRHMEIPVYFIIDALDECREDEVRSVANYLRELTDTAYTADNRMWVCMSSRRYPTISISRCPEIDVEDGNRVDVSAYVHQKITSHADGSVPQSLAISVDKKASHVFLWAVLVVEMLLRAWDNGKTLRELEAILAHVPRVIEEVFDDLIDTLTGQERAEATRLFQWVLFSRGTISLGAIQYGIIFGEESPPRSFAEVHEKRGKFETQQLIRRVTHFSRGLIEVIKSSSDDESFIVQVIHESVRDWLLFHGGFGRLDTHLQDLCVAKGDLSIVNACLNILQASDFHELHPLRLDIAEHPKRIPVGISAFKGKGAYWRSNQVHDGYGETQGKEDDILGITTYCTYNIFWHAKKAEELELVPIPMLECLSNTNAVAWTNLLHAYTRDELLHSHPSTSSLCALLCRKGFSASVTWLMENNSVQKTKSVPRSAIIAAINGFHLSTLDALDSQEPLCSVRDQRGRNGFLLACSTLAKCYNDDALDILEFFLERGCDINTKDHDGMTGVMIIADEGAGSSRGNTKWPYLFFRTLVDYGASIDTGDHRGRTALHWAVEKNNFEATTSLLELGASPWRQDDEGQLAVHKAAALDLLELANILLNCPGSSDSLNVKDKAASTPLHLAALCSSGELVRALVGAGADTNCLDETGQTPLHIAARKVDYETLQAMLHHGADRAVKDRFGMTAADHAESVAREESIIALLSFVLPPNHGASVFS